MKKYIMIVVEEIPEAIADFWALKEFYCFPIWQRDVQEVLQWRYDNVLHQRLLDFMITEGIDLIIRDLVDL